MQLALTLGETLKGEISAEARLDRAAPDADLSPLEREVVGIGRTDAQDGVLISGDRRLVDRLRGCVALLTGRRRATRLADPRLETLRRFAQRAALGREEIADFRAMRNAGYAALQIVMAANLARHADSDGAQ